jgi:dephospho-CoA kinase
MRDSYLIGLTGGIASGKNAVADMLARRGAAVVDADRVSRDLVAPGSPMLGAMVAAWGPDILDASGALDRKVMAARVFGRDEEVQRLNAITHPAILAEMRKRVETAPEPFVVFMAPLLFEAGGDGMVDEVWVVRADEDVRVQRVLARDGLTEAQARARISAQWRPEESVRRAHVVIENNGDPRETEAQVGEAWQRIQARVGERR